MHAHSYFRSALEIIDLYKGGQPFAGWLRKYFSSNKKFGSRDRKWVSHLCYSYYRTGRAFEGHSQQEKMLRGLFLVSNTKSELLGALDPELNEHAEKTFQEKLEVLKGQEWDPVGTLGDHLSPEIDPQQFSRSIYKQPDLFLRIRPGNNENVKIKMQNASIPFEEVADGCIALANNTNLENVIDLDKEAAVQDRNSQRSLDSFFENYKGKESFFAWDCCAASGGKSLLLYDHFPKVQLTISDVRESILFNLQNRFKRAGVPGYKSLVADVSSPDFSPPGSFDLVICDAPCSGSGTWSRTPEQLYYFSAKDIERYASLQKKIALNAVKAVKPGGYFVYITCSVFKKENDEVVRDILAGNEMKLIGGTYVTGYDKKADTLYSALFTRQT